MAKENINNIRVVSLSTHKFTDYKPIMSVGKKWVLNGKKNEGYTYVIDRYKFSPTNATIIDSYANFTYGKGLNSQEFLKLMNKNELRKLVKDFTLFREGAVEVILEKGSDRIAKINHLPKQKVLPNEVDSNGKILNYWFCYDWNKTNIYTPEPIPLYTSDTKEKRSVYIFKEYNVDEFYFARPSYYSALNYAKLEEEISKYCVNHIQNGLSAGHIINVNEGITDDEVKDAYEKAIINKWTGAENANKFILSFNTNKENATTIESVVVSDAHQQYQFLTEEARKQLMIGHKVTSPIIFGIKDNTGFGNNADEMQTAFDELMINVITPIQEPLLDGFMELGKKNGITENMEFIPLRQKAITQQTAMSSQKKNNLDNEIADGLIALGDEIDLNEWELVSEAVVNHSDDNKFHSFATTGIARPNANSENDDKNYKVRYKYNGKISENSREFCRKMINASKIYRKEDIESMNSLVVNEGWGEYGTEPYSIWKFKGGGACRHNWLRQIYVKKGVNVDVNSPLAELININEARRKGFDKDLNDLEAFVIPNNLPNNGFLHK